MKLDRFAVCLAVATFIMANIFVLPLVAHAIQPQSPTHLFQSKEKPRVKIASIYDGPFKHGSPMLTHQEDSAAVTDCFACLHLSSNAGAAAQIQLKQ